VPGAERQRVAGRVDDVPVVGEGHAVEQHRNGFDPRLGGERRRPAGQGRPDADRSGRRLLQVDGVVPVCDQCAHGEVSRVPAQVGVDDCAGHDVDRERLPDRREREQQREPPRLLAVQPGAPGGEPLVGEVDLPEDLPAVAKSRAGQHLVGRHRDADPGPHGGGQRRGKLVEPGVRRDQKAEQGQLAEQPVGPVPAHPGDAPEPAHGVGRAGRLRVDQPGGHRLIRPVAGPLDAGQTVGDLVGEPPVELVHAGGDPVGALLGPLARGRRVGLATGCGGGRWAGRAGHPGRLPLGDPVGCRRVGHAARGPHQHQAERVLARELPARAGAPVCRLGQVDTGLVRVLAAAPAQPPEQVVVTPGGLPLRGRAEPLSGPRGAGIRSEREHLRGAPPFDRHRRNVVRRCDKPAATPRSTQGWIPGVAPGCGPDVQI
jgi:hypothetical protein